MRRTRIILWLLLVAAPAAVFAQQSTPPLRVDSVRLGMKKVDVLAGLAGNYQLLKADVEPGSETWIVRDKQPTPDSTFYDLTFVDDKLYVISAQLQPDFVADGVRLGRRLFSQFSMNANPPKNPDKLQSRFNVKQVTVPVTLREVQSDSITEQSIYFHFEDYTLVLQVNTMENGDAWVRLQRNKAGD